MIFPKNLQIGGNYSFSDIIENESNNLKKRIEKIIISNLGYKNLNIDITMNNNENGVEINIYNISKKDKKKIMNKFNNSSKITKEINKLLNLNKGQIIQ